ncbi:MAG: N-formylglutamate amidohydrolase [Rhizobiales bacterium]|nr:N-formylglutamate amidohydrolase [Hyphomicrobiales bacterium]
MRTKSKSPEDLFDPPFQVVEPGQLTVPVVFNSPHSGNQYPASFVAASKLDPKTLRKSEDALIDELFLPVVALGAPLVKANFPRAYLDVNREPYELDPSMFIETLPDYVNCTSLRVAGGLGTIPRVVSETEEIYAHRLTFSQAEDRIRDLYLPYHRCLSTVLNRVYTAFGVVLLIDCHSMPSAGFADDSLKLKSRPDIVLGDRYGSTCNPDAVYFLESAFRAAGYSVTRNKPYAGGHITQNYSKRTEGRHSVQIEINRALYMDEESLQPHDGFIGLRTDLAKIMRSLLGSLPDILRPSRIAAE